MNYPQSMTPLSVTELLTPAEVASLFRVDPKTVTRWAKAGKIGARRTLGGHRRFLRTEVEALLTREDGCA
jgi:excisionase family DNA binding protein